MMCDVQILYVELYTLAGVIVFLITIVEENGGGALSTTCDATVTSLTHGSVQVELNNGCVAANAQVGVWSARNQSFDLTSYISLNDWKNQTGTEVEWVFTKEVAAGSVIDAHMKRDCLVASDFRCFPHESTDKWSDDGASQQASWCFAEIVTNPQMKGVPRSWDTITGTPITGRISGDGSKSPVMTGNSYYPNACEVDGISPEAEACAQSAGLLDSSCANITFKGSGTQRNRESVAEHLIDACKSLRDLGTDDYGESDPGPPVSFHGGDFDEGQHGTVLVQLLNPMGCTADFVQSSDDADLGNLADSPDQLATALPLLYWFICFAAVAVADRILIMSLVVSNYLTDLVVASAEIVEARDFPAFERQMALQARSIPKWFFLCVLLPVMASVSYSILAMFLAKDFVDASNREFETCVLEIVTQTVDASRTEMKDENGHYMFDENGNYIYTETADEARARICKEYASGGSTKTNTEPYISAFFGTLPAVQLFTPVLAAVLLMLIVIELHALQIDAAQASLYKLTGASWPSEPKWLHRNADVGRESAPLPDHVTLETADGPVDDDEDRVTAALRPFVAVRASLLKTSKEWSFILATEVLVVALLMIEPALQAATPVGGAGGSCVHTLAEYS